jgi:hypothetical protein
MLFTIFDNRAAEAHTTRVLHTNVRIKFSSCFKEEAPISTDHVSDVLLVTMETRLTRIG